MKQNFLDRTISYFAPTRGVKRALARQTLELGHRYYDAARASHTTYGWLSGSTSANAEIYGGLVALRNRSRDLVRNNPHGLKAIQSLVSDAVGDGIVGRAKTGDRALDKKINELWKRFVDECDADGHYDFYGLQKLAVQSTLEGGEAIGIYQPRRKRDGFNVPLQIRVVEGDLLDHRKNARLDDGGRIIQGIEVDSFGRRVAYNLFNEHPGEYPLNNSAELATSRVSANVVQHLYEKKRPGQMRGVPWLHAIILKLRELDTYEEAELVRKRLEACLAAIVTSPEGIADPVTGDVKVTPGITDMAGNAAEQVEPGMFYYARGGSDIKFTNPSAVPNYADYKRSQLHSLAAGANMTYEDFSGDLSQVNYSSLRAGKVAFRRMMSQFQNLTLVPVLCQPTWNRFIDFSVTTGDLPRNVPYTADWTPPAFEAIDPLKDYKADQIAVRSGMMTLREMMARRGLDLDEVLEEIRDTNALLDKYDITLDSDPRRTAVSGGTYAEPSSEGEPPPPGEEPATKNPVVKGGKAEAELIDALKRVGLNGQAAPLARAIIAARLNA